MKEKNFSKFFNGNADDAYDTITDAMDSFVEYQNHVINMGVVQPTLHARYEGQKHRDKLEELDRTRKIKHDAAIANASMLNRICDHYGIERIVPVDTNDRYAIADLIGDFCAEVYEENKSGRKLSAKEHGEILDQHIASR